MLTCALQVGEGARGERAAGLEPSHEGREGGGRRGAAPLSRKAPSAAPAGEAAEKVGVGVSQPRRRRREEEEDRGGSSPPAGSGSLTPREEASWLVAQNSRWGTESWNRTAGRELGSQPLSPPFSFHRGIN